MARRHPRFLKLENWCGQAGSRSKPVTLRSVLLSVQSFYNVNSLKAKIEKDIFKLKSYLRVRMLWFWYSRSQSAFKNYLVI